MDSNKITPHTFLCPVSEPSRLRHFPLKISTLYVEKIYICMCVWVIYIFHLQFFFPFIFSPLLQKLHLKCCNLIRKCCFRWYFKPGTEAKVSGITRESPSSPESRSRIFVGTEHGSVIRELKWQMLGILGGGEADT